MNKKTILSIYLTIFVSASLNATTKPPTLDKPSTPSELGSQLNLESPTIDGTEVSSPVSFVDNEGGKATVSATGADIFDSPPERSVENGNAQDAPKEEIKEKTPSLIPLGGYIRPEDIAIPPKIPGYRLYQVDRNVKVSGVLDGGGTFDAILPVYVYYPNSKTLNLNNELKQAIDSMDVISTEIVTLKQYTSTPGSRRLNDAIEELSSRLNTLQTISAEEVEGFKR